MSIDGPREDEPTMLPTSGIETASETLTLTVWPAVSWALIAFDSDCWMTIVGTKVSPPPNEKLTGSPGATRPRRTAVAPALAARSTLRLNAQAPRSMRATLPAGFARYGSSGFVALIEPAGQPRPTNTTSPAKPVPIGAQATVSVFGYVPAMAAGLFTTSGKVAALGTWVWATEIADFAALGVSRMYGLLAPLPAAVTERTPTLLAWSTAYERSSSKAIP